MRIYATHLYNLGYGTARSGRLPCKEDNSGVRIPSIPPSSWPARRCRKLVKHGATACPPQGIFQRCWASPKTAQCPPMVSSSKWIGSQPLKLVIVSSNLRETTIKIHTANRKQCFGYTTCLNNRSKRFKSVFMYLVYARLAQLVNAHALQAWDSEFKSRASHQLANGQR